MTSLTICKLIFLFLGILYGFSNVVKAFRHQRIENAQLVLMTIGIVGFIGLEFYM